ncbi:MAG: tripartite tricarboxylate transporter substrate-binding protein [Xanthobacteraceae bacterium]
MLTRLVLAIALATATAALPANAQTYPTHSISMIVPYPAGGVTDGLARLLAEHMKASLGQPVIVENVGGAGGSIGAGRVARAAPDGYTILFGNAETHVFNAAVQTLQFDVVKDFEPIALMPRYPFILVTSNAVPAQNLKELVAWIKANPAKVSQGTVGAGTVQHLCGLSMQDMMGVRWQLVPYRGGAPAMQDLLSGQINLMCTASGSFLPLIRNNQIRAYAVTTKERIVGAPDIPTVDEAGLPGLYVSVWNALYAPKGTPKDAIDRLNTAANAALADPTIQRRVTVDMGLDMPAPNMRTPDALGALQKAEIEKWWPIVKAANVKAQ